MTPPLVSILIPSFNHAPFLRQRIDSILAQTYSEYEVIILDDNSEDESSLVLNEYRNHPKISQIILKTSNSGSPFGLWGEGLRYAKGDLIWIAESDDYCESVFLERLVSNITPDTSVIFSKSVQIDEKGKVIYLPDLFQNFFPEKWSNSYSNNGLLEIAECFTFVNIIGNCSSAIFRKPKKFPHKISEWRFAGDWYFWIQLLSEGNVQYVAEPLNYWRRHKSSTAVMFSRQLEFRRYQEVKYCILFARSISKKIRSKFSNSFVEQCYLESVLHRTKKLGRLSRFGLLPPLPWFLLPRYYWGYFKLLLLGQDFK